MIDYNTPPELTMHEIVILLQHMQPEDVKKFNEYYMINFPNWLAKIVKREVELASMTFENFVRLACIGEIRNRVDRRAHDEANGSI